MQDQPDEEKVGYNFLNKIEALADSNFSKNNTVQILKGLKLKTPVVMTDI